MPHQQRIQKSDLLWLLAYPVYQVLGTARHEASHALVAHVEGAKIEQFVVLPSIVRGQFLWGSVVWSGPTDWVPTAAPYLCDLLTYLLCFFLCTRLPFRRHWVWINLVILGLISPLVNSGYEYLIAFLRPGSDVAHLFQALPPLAVHAYFGVTLTGYVLGLLVLLIAPGRTSCSSTLTTRPGAPDGPPLARAEAPRRRRLGLVTLLVVLALIGGGTAYGLSKLLHRGFRPTFTVVRRTASAPLPIQVPTTVTARCLSGEQLLSGGYLVSDRGNPVDESYPSTPSSWTVTASSGFAQTTLFAYALCLQANFSAQIQIFPFQGSLSQPTTAPCPTGSALTGGGFRFSAAISAPNGNGWQSQGAFGGNSNFALCATANVLPAAPQMSVGSVPPRGRTHLGLTCPAGELLTGGGFTYATPDPADVYASGPVNNSARWEVGVFNYDDSITNPATGWAVCVRVPAVVHELVS